MRRKNDIFFFFLSCFFCIFVTLSSVLFSTNKNVHSQLPFIFKQTWITSISSEIIARDNSITKDVNVEFFPLTISIMVTAHSLYLFFERKSAFYPSSQTKPAF